MAQERLADLKASLRYTLDHAGIGAREDQSWIASFESVFGKDYDALARDMARFLIDAMRKDDQQRRTEEAAWRATGRTAEKP